VDNYERLFLLKISCILQRILNLEQGLLLSVWMEETKTEQMCVWMNGTEWWVIAWAICLLNELLV